MSEERPPIKEDAPETRDEKPIMPFYPDLIPAEDGHPSSADFVVVDTGDARGRGLRGKRAFFKDEWVAKLSGIVVTRTSLDTIQVSPTLHYCDPWFSRYLLHSCYPNLEISVERMCARALRDIAPRELLTIDYATTDDTVTVQFACQCGAPTCRGWVKGRAEAMSEEGLSHLTKRRLQRSLG